MFNFFFQSKTKHLSICRIAQRKFAKIVVEQLEDRTLPSATLLPSHLVQLHPTYEVVQARAGSHGLQHPAFGPLVSPAGFNPTQVRHAYGTDQITFQGNIAGDGTGQTIALVDAYDDPTAASDLTAFDKQFGLADPTFIKVGIDPVGNGSTTTFPNPDANWSIEIALDVEWAHAIAPKATILLVEANSSNLNDLLNAVDYARNYAGVAAVSMSWGGSEFSGETSYNSYFTTPAGHSGVTFFASSGDGGAPALFPSITDHVVSVGGTSLTVDGSGNWASETGWSGSGGSISSFVSQPSYQNNLAIYSASANGMRAAPDVAYNADPNTGVAVLATYGYGGWLQVGGTSAASPQWAALMAITDQGRALSGNAALDGYTQTLPDLYQLPANDFHDIVSGYNGYPAGAGFDLVTGLGSPVATSLIPDLVGVKQVLTSITVAPANAKVADGGQQQFTATGLDQFGKPLGAQPTFTWSLVSGLGSVDGNGLYSAPSSGAGSATIQASTSANGATLTATAKVAFLTGPSITMLTANPNPVTGATTSLTAQVADSNAGALTYTWSIVSEPAGAAAPTLNPSSGSSAPGSLSTTATFFQAGAYQFQFGVTDGAGISSSATVSVTVNQTLTSVVLSPATVSVTDSAQQQFSAAGQDQFGNAMASQPAFSWTIVSGLGAVDANGLYTAPSSGSGTDTVGASATVNGITVTGTATAAYAPGFSITSISATPNPVAGATTSLSAVVANPGGGSVFYMWSVVAAPAGALIPTFDSAAAASPTATFYRAGSYTFQVMVWNQTFQMTSATVDVTVNQTLTSVMMTPPTASVPVGSRQQFFAFALDQFQQPLAATFIWTVASGPGSVNSTGLYTAPVTGSGAAIVKATASVNGVTVSGSATVTLLAAPIITSISATPNPVTGTTANLSVVASNPGGGPLTYSWIPLTTPSGAKFPTLSAVAASSTTATFFQAGSYTFQVMVTNQYGLTTTATVSVTVNSVFTSVKVTPATASVRRGSQQQFTAYAFDQFGKVMALQPKFTWSIVKGPGTINSTTGLYKAPKSGTGSAIIQAKATVNGITRSSTATITVK